MDTGNTVELPGDSRFLEIPGLRRRPSFTLPVNEKASTADFLDIVCHSSFEVHSNIPSIGHWVKLRILGSSNNGVVYLARRASDVTLDSSLFVVKQLFLSNASCTLHCLPPDMHMEIKALVLLNGHPNSIRMLGAEILDHLLFIYMEYIDGGSVASLLKDRFNEGLCEEMASDIAAQVLNVVTHMTNNASFEVIHRDIKGSNVLVGSDGRVSLCDFGSSKISRIAKSSSDVDSDGGGCSETYGGRLSYISDCACTVLPRTEFSGHTEFSGPMEISDLGVPEGTLEGPTSIKGTCNWMAPEVIAGSRYGSPCDVWSIGCLVIEMVTGRLPWMLFDNPLAGMFRINQSPDTPLDVMPEETRRRLSPLCIDFLRCCLNRDPAARWSAKELRYHPWVFLHGLAAQYRAVDVDDTLENAGQ